MNNNNKYFFIYKLTGNDYKIIYYNIFQNTLEEISFIITKNITLIILDINFQKEDFLYCLDHFYIKKFILIEDLLLFIISNYILISLDFLNILIKKNDNNNIIFCNLYINNQSSFQLEESFYKVHNLSYKDFLFLIGNYKPRRNFEYFLLNKIIFFQKYTKFFLIINFFILIMNFLMIIF